MHSQCPYLELLRGRLLERSLVITQLSLCVCSTVDMESICYGIILQMFETTKNFKGYRVISRNEFSHNSFGHVAGSQGHGVAGSQGRELAYFLSQNIFIEVSWYFRKYFSV